MARKWWTLLVVCVGSFMLLLDVTIVNVALPQIERDLHATLTDLQWVIDAYVLALASLTLIAGSLGDRLGRRRVFVGGLTLFTLASLVAGFASDPLQLELARALQGVGGAGMFGTVLALIAQEFPAGERAVALGAWGATVGAAVAVGPLVGGLVVEELGWEWIFFINIPIGIAAVAVTLVRVAESRERRQGGLDWPGVATLASGLFLLVFGLVRGNGEGWSSPEIVASLAGSAALLVAFVAIELVRAEPLLEVRLFRVPAFAGASVGAVALSAGLFAMLLYFVLYLQNVLGYSPLETGVRLLPITLAAFFFAPLAAKLAERVPLRVFLGAGLAIVGTGLLVMRGLEADSEWTALLVGFLLAGAGAGLVNPTLAEAAIGVVPRERAGVATGINNTFRQIGIAVGIAVLGALFQGRVETKLDDTLTTGPAALRPLAGDLSEAVASGNTEAALARAPDGTDGFLATAAREAFVSGLNRILLVAAVVALSGAVLSFVLVRPRDLRREELEQPPEAEPALDAAA
jgi:EmrB/QacA subfamily drug resistance transporter